MSGHGNSSRIDGEAPIRLFFDFGFLLCIVAALLLTRDVLPFLVLFGILPLPFLWLKSRPHPVLPIWTVLFPAGLYLGYALWAYVAFPGLPPGASRPVNPDLELYFGAVALLATGLLRSVQIERLADKLRRTLPWMLFAAFAVLSVLMFFDSQANCRITAGAAWPFIPALLFSSLSMISLVGWEQLGSGERRLRLLLLAGSIVVAVAYTGSRGVTVALAAVLLVLVAAGFHSGHRGRLPHPRAVLGSVLLGIALCGATELVTDCGIFDRLDTILRPFASALSMAAELAVSAAFAEPSHTRDGANLSAAANDLAGSARDASIGLRLQMWAAALDAIREAPLFGHGALSQHLIIQPLYGHAHAHNQFLSWLITGGILQLALGLFFLATPVFITKGLAPPDRVIVVSASTGLWGASMMFDSFLQQDFFLHYFCMLLGFLYALSNDIQKRAPSGSVSCE